MIIELILSNIEFRVCDLEALIIQFFLFTDWRNITVSMFVINISGWASEKIESRDLKLHVRICEACFRRWRDSVSRVISW